MAQNKGNTYADYFEAYKRLGSYTAVGRELGVCESTVRRAIQDASKRDPAMQDALGRVD